MASTWSDNLKIELLGTGDTNWGDLTNNNFKWALEESITGYATATFPSDADYNWGASFTNSNSSQAQRNLVIRVTGTLSATRNFIVPLNSAGTAPIEKQYIIFNNTTGSQAITVKTPAGTGVTVPNGVRMHVYVDGTNVVQMDDYDVSRTIGTLSLTNALSVANGGTGATTLTGIVKASGASAFTAGNVSLTSEVTGTLPVANGGTGASSFTANNVLLGNGTGALQVVAPGANGNVLQSNGTTWVSATSTATSPAGSNTQIQYNNSGAFGASSLLTFSNSHLTVNGISIGTGLFNDLTSTAVGNGALQKTTSGGPNLAFGYLAGYEITSGSYNVAIGPYALQNLKTGNDNIAIGASAGAGVATTVIRSIMIGRNAGESAAGDNNILIGYFAGSTISSGNNVIVIGNNAQPSSATTTNEITLGPSSINKLRVPGISLTAGVNYINVSESTVASLPSASTAGSGARAFVTDANATTFASTVAGGGSNKVPVYSDGTNWRIG